MRRKMWNTGLGAVLLAAAVIMGSLSTGAAEAESAAGQETENVELQTEESTAGREQERAASQGTEAQAESKVASADEMAAPETVVEDWMVPISGSEMKDGTYEVEVASSSSMFKIEHCELTVENGEMRAVMTMGGQGYLYLYMGTGEEAANASEEEYIPFKENAEGKHTFTVPVEALDQGIACAAFSKKKEKWYDRELVFKSNTLSADAFKEREMTTLEELKLEEGTYTAAVTLSGGSGKTTVESPAVLKVEDGVMTATIIFSSPYYDYVLVNGEKYEPVNAEGNSAFELPVDGFDYNMAITADTVAMSTPHEIDYTLFFDSSTVEAKE